MECFENVKKLSMLMMFLILEIVTVSDVTGRTVNVNDRCSLMVLVI